MTISIMVFSWLIGVALLLTVAAPVLLFTLLLRDWKNGELW